MGLTSTSFIVTIQGAVPREQRGSATAANMFMKNFGSTIGAALFGAVLNGSLLARFTKEQSGMELEDINLLLTDENRRMLSQEQLFILQDALEKFFAMGVYRSCSFCSHQFAAYITDSTWKGVIT